MQKLKNIKQNFFEQQHFFYPILFYENIYSIAYNRFINQSKNKQKTFIGLKKKFHFFQIKRLTMKIKQKSYFDFKFISSKSYLEIIEEVLTIFFETNSKNSQSLIQEIKSWNNSESIQSIFPFMEDKFFYSDKLLDVTIPFKIHPEILIRVFRTKFDDVSFLHLLRLFLYKNKNFLFFSFFFKKKQFSFFLWNFYITQFESFFFFFSKHLKRSNCVSIFCLVDKNQSIQKLKENKLNRFYINKKIIDKNVSIHFVRYQNHLVIAIDEIKYFKRNWKYFVFYFWQKYFHFWLQSYQLKKTKLKNNYFYFLGYIFCIEIKKVLVQIKIGNFLTITNFFIKKFDGIIPIQNLITLLSKKKLCDNLGSPICKLSWTILPDDEIFKRFDQISKTIYYYYSGCCKKKGLYKIQYILRFSCAKTLACKHKSTIRIVWKKYGLNLFKHSSFLKKTTLNFSKFYQKTKKKFWYLSILQTNYLTTLLKYNYKNEKV